ncbi:dephospho-CoA kinase [Marinitoga sp. 38H-ov]|uniref:dephospho-CoA kinase n=1 Tax=Marinitoga sp. 38H-ov TaxID=1755814 RepID=UPI0013EE1338|nr:dephospho-CoA kinase [Marinitoga sp. 38H-ov]KAF2955874.1 hypothetical protein AS160_08600 [Marinitoga sp. 38H-ov]
MKVIGITGYAGSGKSTIAKILKNLGYYIIDLDEVGHLLLKDKKIIERLVDLFGKNILKNNQINRNSLAQIVFSSNEKLELLNSLLHPKIKQYVINEINNSQEDIIFIDGALIEKIGLDEICDYIILIDSPEDLRLKRLINYRGLSYEKAKNILNSQKDLSFTYDFKIINDGSLERIKKDLVRIINDF